jgi:hypothetical protein
VNERKSGLEIQSSAVVGRACAVYGVDFALAFYPSEMSATRLKVEKKGYSGKLTFFVDTFTADALIACKLRCSRRYKVAYQRVTL